MEVGTRCQSILQAIDLDNDKIIRKEHWLVCMQRSFEW